ncbi:MAG: intradiol ring-cleavage dioxygenase, partial [Ramlibacter sp.]
WQCDAQGHYHHPGDGNRAAAAFQGFGRVQADAQGRWRFRTIRPVAYTGRTPHIHVKVRAGRREVLTTQLYVEGDPHNARDGIWRQLSPEDRAAVTAPFRREADGLAAEFPLVVAA